MTGSAPLDAVLEPVRAYLAGHATGDPAHFRRAFLPTAHVEGLREGRFVSWDLDTYCGLFDGTPAPDEARRRREVDLVAAGATIAVARVRLDHVEARLVDLLLLVDTDDGWRIANKVYEREVP
jgi:hypothetical protein